ncbi:thiamine phosphate synthase [Bacillus spongiae]|uniref:Thiamine-phosphate synthase n=1 Tax=Bacillus spongiae TaxID=2683610 RepID=A0ABU8HHQ5_9BACI
MENNIDYGLYLVTDESLPLTLLEEKIIGAMKGGASIIQLREKESTSKEFINKAKRLKAILSETSIPLIINDRLDIALLVEADGIHLGQDDLPAREVKKILPAKMILGVSVHSVQEALQAERDGADYIGVGSVFKTSSKPDATPISFDEVVAIKKSVSIPVVGIGGITEENVDLIKELGIDGVAIVSAIMKKEDTKKATEQLKRKLTWL